MPTAPGGEIVIEDGEPHPPPGQRIDRALLDQLRQRSPELLMNVEMLPEVRLRRCV